jgi:hypothetical protein
VSRPEISAGRFIEWLDITASKLLVEGYVDHYNNVRLNSATGYITPKDMLAGAAAGDPRGAQPKMTQLTIEQLNNDNFSTRYSPGPFRPDCNTEFPGWSTINCKLKGSVPGWMSTGTAETALSGVFGQTAWRR